MLEYQTDFQRLLSILNILNELANSDEFKILNGEGFSMEASIKDNDRINLVFNFVKINFKEELLKFVLKVASIIFLILINHLSNSLDKILLNIEIN